ncbi:unnamed protein product [Closterium sp. NIES-64]|nr:unnamed protein product [Closterium sp. NIES-64]
MPAQVSSSQPNSILPHSFKSHPTPLNPLATPPSPGNCRARQVPSAPPATLCPPRHARIEPFTCPSPLPPVYARPGVFLTARITPALPGVNVSVVADSASDAGGWKAGELVGWRLTEGWHGVEKGRRDLGESDGEEGRVAGAGMEGEDNTEEVVLGPLYDDASYHVELSKVGYSGGALGWLSGCFVSVAWVGKGG